MPVPQLTVSGTPFGGAVAVVADAADELVLTAALESVSPGGVDQEVVAARERDEVRSEVERLSGGKGEDTLTGNGADNRPSGHGGNGQPTGGAGRD